MKHLYPISVLLLMISAGAPAEIIDRIAVSVGTQVITTSDIDREIRVVAFLNGTPADFSPASRKEAADRMVQQRLILREVENNRYPEPAPSVVDPLIAEFKKKNFASEEDYKRELANRGITDEDVRNMLLWQRRMLQFLDIRFRPGVVVSAQDVQNAFNKDWEPRLAKEHPGEKINIEDYRDEIAAKLTADAADAQMNTWIENTRKHSQIVYHEEVFQ